MTRKVNSFLYLFIVIVSLSRSNCQEVRQILPAVDENGEKSSSTRIIGGTNAALGEYPGMISLQRKAMRNHVCGGTLIDATHVLTAAHCVTDPNSGAVFSPSTHYLMGNTLTILPQYNPNNQSRDATHVFVHQQYNTRSLVNDIAIIRVSPPFTFTSTFYPAVPIASTPAENSNCSVAGWGVIRNGTNISSSTLLRVNISIVSNSRCNAAYGGGIQSGMLCAGDWNGGKDSCQGDSGGGLYCGNFIAGIVSFGYECAHPLFPGVYTNVATYRSWINNQIAWNGEHSQIPTPTTQRPTNSAVSTMISIYTVMTALFGLVLR